MENKESVKPDQESKEVLKEASDFNNSKNEIPRAFIKSSKTYENEMKNRQNLKISLILTLKSLIRLMDAGIDVIQDVM